MHREEDIKRRNAQAAIRPVYRHPRDNTGVGFHRGETKQTTSYSHAATEKALGFKCRVSRSAAYGDASTAPSYVVDLRPLGIISPSLQIVAWAASTSTEDDAAVAADGDGDVDMKTDGTAAPAAAAASTASSAKELAALRVRIDALKSGFDSPVPNYLFLMARDACNPRESNKKCGFMNRAAVKLVEMEALVGGFPTSTGPDGKTPLLYVADMCSGPGGFAEYLLSKFGWRTQIFGTTLRGGHGPLARTRDHEDFKLHKFHTHHAYYGESGSSHATGDVLDERNLRGYIEWVRKVHRPQGVDLAMGDGGFSVKGRENKQEELSLRLIVCQLAGGLALVRAGGDVACKVFDLWTDDTRMMLAFYATWFDDWCLPQLAQSRPANSERFVYFRGAAADDRARRQFVESLVSDTWRTVVPAMLTADTKRRAQYERNAAFIRRAAIEYAREQAVYLECIHSMMTLLCDDTGGQTQRGGQQQQQQQQQQPYAPAYLFQFAAQEKLLTADDVAQPWLDFWRYEDVILPMLERCTDLAADEIKPLLETAIKVNSESKTRAQYALVSSHAGRPAQWIELVAASSSARTLPEIRLPHGVVLLCDGPAEGTRSVCVRRAISLPGVDGLPCVGWTSVLTRHLAHSCLYASL